MFEIDARHTQPILSPFTRLLERKWETNVSERMSAVERAGTKASVLKRSDCVRGANEHMRAVERARASEGSSTERGK